MGMNQIPRGDRLPVLAVTGLMREARIAAGPGVVVLCGGGSSLRLRGLLATRHGHAFGAVISFGIAGALDPALAPGDLVIATEVMGERDNEDVSGAVFAALTQRLAALRPVATGIAGVDVPAMDGVEKSALRAATAAGAVDMETHVAAEFAAAHGLPFGAVRAICDPARRTLPPLVATAVRPDGSTDVLAVVRGIASRPRQSPALFGTARDAAAAFRSLRRCRRLLGFGLGLAHLG